MIGFDFLSCTVTYALRKLSPTVYREWIRLPLSNQIFLDFPSGPLRRRRLLINSIFYIGSESPGYTFGTIALAPFEHGPCNVVGSTHYQRCVKERRESKFRK
ncbi:hypothetical protein AB1N83_008796 [Pleurotus pulmonarius]